MLAKEAQLHALVGPVVEALELTLWGVEYLTQGRQTTVRIYLDDADKPVDVEDCARVSRQVSAVFDVEDPISGEYTLEVSSPGLDRPLFSLDHYQRYLGEQAKIRLRSSFDGRRNFSGRLMAVEGDEVVLAVDDEEYLLPFELIDRAHIVAQF